MKTKIWAAAIGLLLALCLGLSFFLLRPQGAASHAEILSGGKVLHLVDLSVDREITVETGSGRNVVTVKDGAIAVTEASCPDHYCMQRGFCSGGTQIVCLPNRLVIRFTGAQEVDFAVG